MECQVINWKKLKTHDIYIFPSSWTKMYALKKGKGHSTTLWMLFYFILSPCYVKTKSIPASPPPYPDLCIMYSIKIDNACISLNRTNQKFININFWWYGDWWRKRQIYSFKHQSCYKMHELSLICNGKCWTSHTRLNHRL